MKPFRVNFGKWKGRRIIDVPQDYLEWVSRWGDLKEPLRSAVHDELKRRAEEASESDAPPTRTSENLSVVVVERTRRLMALRFHPDRGGSHEAMQAVNVMADTLIEAVESGPA